MMWETMTSIDSGSHLRYDAQHRFILTERAHVVMKTAAIGMARLGYISLGLFFMCHPALAEQDIQQGLWEITIRTEMAGVQGDALLPKTQTHCVSDKEEIPKIIRQNRNCRITGSKTEGNEASWNMRCLDQRNTLRGTGKIIYKGDLFDGLINLSMKQPGGELIKLIQYIKGKRIGECP